jgi:NAD(P)-dependent dehydrogenase (short-subunit alcohol dehydrogenase family)
VGSARDVRIGDGVGEPRPRRSVAAAERARGASIQIRLVPTSVLLVRVALVTGGNRGIGFEVCRQLGRLDYAVLLGARDLAKGEEAAGVLSGEGLNVSALKLDVTSEQDVERLGELERVDALVNNAAIAPDSAHPDTSAQYVPPELVRFGFETNTLGPYRVCQQIIPIMRRLGYGRIVNITSGMAQLAEMNGGSPGYRLSKTALNALTRVLADELNGMNILVNSVDPGWVKTDMGGRSAPLTPAQGAETIVWAATLPDVGPTGGFFKEKRQIAW